MVTKLFVMNTKKLNFTVISAFILIVLIGGINFVAVRFSNKELPPFWGATLRFTSASLLLFAIVYFKKLPLPSGRALLGAIIYGLLGFGGAYAFAYISLVKISAGMGAVILSLTPLLTFFLAILHGLEKFKFRGIAGGVVALFGILLLFQNQIGGDTPIFFMITMMGAAICAAYSTVVVKWFPKNHPATINAFGMASGSILLFSLSLFSGESFFIPSFFSTWLALLYLILIGSVGLFLLFIYVLNRWTASSTSYTFVLTPIVALLGSAILENESISIFFIVSSLIVLIGVYIGALSKVARKDH